jgi:signal transduction histidine kinase
VALRVENERVVWTTASGIYPAPTVVLALSIAVVCYVVARLGDVLDIPQKGVPALWPENAVLVSMLLLMPRRTWPVLIPAGLAGLTVENLQVGFPPPTVAMFFLSVAFEIIMIMVGFGNSFEQVPHLNTLKTLARYSLFAILIAPFIGSLVDAIDLPGLYWTNWRIIYFSKAIAYLTWTPAILSWASPGSVRAHRSGESRLEVAALMIALAFLGYTIFFTRWETVPSVLLYSFVPALLWAALRFGVRGVSTSIIAISFCAIWGAIYGRGPFTGSDPLQATLSLQLFLVFAAVPFTLLAVVVQEREQARLVERGMRKRLISEQEKERSRIASELHDDICQRLALLSMELEQADRVRNGAPGGAKDSLELIRRHCDEIAADVQSLSHQLHSSRLDLLGSVAAIRGFCNEVSKKHMVNVEFAQRDVPRNLPGDVSLCLFRVAQEALHNAVKYSGTNEFKVNFSRIADEVRLVVMDQGAGFDAEEAKHKGGLGLVSMQERVQAVNGRFYIESKPGAGTKIIASVPVAAENSAGNASRDDAANVAGADGPSNQRA